jgi:hypothetical protein
MVEDLLTPGGPVLRYTLDSYFGAGFLLFVLSILGALGVGGHTRCGFDFCFCVHIVSYDFAAYYCMFIWFLIFFVRLPCNIPYQIQCNYVLIRL